MIPGAIRARSERGLQEVIIRCQQKHCMSELVHITVSYWSITLRVDILIQLTPVLFNCSRISLLACRRKTTQHRTPCDSNITSIKLHITVSYWSITLRVDILIQLTPVRFNCSRIALLACRRRTTQHRTP